jgi:hypothetical protein
VLVLSSDSSPLVDVLVHDAVWLRKAEDGDSMFLRNGGVYLKVHTALQPRRSSTSSPTWEPQVNWSFCKPRVHCLRALICCYRGHRRGQMRCVPQDLQLLLGFGLNFDNKGTTETYSNLNRSPRSGERNITTRVMQCSLNIMWTEYLEKKKQHESKNN